MKCPNCGYTSFPYLESCAKCGHEQTEPRAALGNYGLRPQPPDLLLAYQAANMQVMDATLGQSLPGPDLNLGQLDEIELELGEATQAGPGPHEGGQHAGGAPDLGPVVDLEATAVEEPPPAEPSVGPVSAQDMAMPQTLDLSELGDITLELETAANLEGQPPKSVPTPRQGPELKPVYDLDLDEDLEDLPLGASVDESHTDDDAEETTEYTLEIEDEVELELEELEMEEDDETGENDDRC